MESNKACSTKTFITLHPQAKLTHKILAHGPLDHALIYDGTSVDHTIPTTLLSLKKVVIRSSYCDFDYHSLSLCMIIMVLDTLMMVTIVTITWLDFQIITVKVTEP